MNRFRRMAIGIPTLLFIWACDSSERISEKCTENGTLAGSKWCNGAFLTDDYKILNNLDNQSTGCSGPISISEEQRSALARNADNITPGVYLSGPGYIWSLVFGRCYFDQSTPKFTSTELSSKIVAFMDSVWKNYPNDFKQAYPSCNLNIPYHPIGQIENPVPYGVVGCSPDNVIDPDGNLIPRIPSGQINTHVKIHFESYYSKSAYDSGSNGSYLIPNSIDSRSHLKNNSGLE